MASLQRSLLHAAGRRFASPAPLRSATAVSVSGRGLASDTSSSKNNADRTKGGHLAASGAGHRHPATAQRQTSANKAPPTQPLPASKSNTSAQPTAAANSKLSTSTPSTPAQQTTTTATSRIAGTQTAPLADAAITAKTPPKVHVGGTTPQQHAPPVPTPRTTPAHTTVNAATQTPSAPPPPPPRTPPTTASTSAKPNASSPLTGLFALLIAVLTSAISIHQQSRDAILGLFGEDVKRQVNSALPKPLFGADGPAASSSSETTDAPANSKAGAPFVPEPPKERPAATSASITQTQLGVPPSTASTKASPATSTSAAQQSVAAQQLPPAATQPVDRPAAAERPVAAAIQSAPPATVTVPSTKLSDEHRAELQRQRDTLSDDERKTLQQLSTSLHELHDMQAADQRQRLQRKMQMIEERDRRIAEQRALHAEQERQYQEQRRQAEEAAEQRQREEERAEQQRQLEAQQRRQDEYEAEQRQQQQQAEEEERERRKRQRKVRTYAVNLPPPPETFDSVEDAERYLRSLQRELDLLQSLDTDSNATINDLLEERHRQLQADHNAQLQRHTTELEHRYADQALDQQQQLLDYYSQQLQQTQTSIIRDVSKREYGRYRRTLAKQLDDLYDNYQATKQYLLDEQQRALQLEAAADRHSRLGALSALTSRAKAYEEVFTRQEAYDLVSARVHRLAVTLMALEHLLTSHRGSFELEWKALAKAGEGDAVIQAAVQSIPDTVVINGVMQPEELKASFKTLESRLRELLFLPPEQASKSADASASPSSGVLVNLLATVASALTLHEPAHAASDTENDDHAKLSHAYRAVQRHNQLEHAVQLVESISDPRVREAAADWLYHARQRLNLEQAVHLVDSRVAEISQHMVVTEDEEKEAVRRRAEAEMKQGKSSQTPLPAVMHS